jgi:hypothetical protein
VKRGTPQHPKMRTLARLLDVPAYAAVGILEMLWHFTAQFCEAGDVGRWSNTDIAAALDWTGDPDHLVEALISSRWLDRSDAHRLIVHDWHEHAEDSLQMRMARSLRRFANGAIPKLGQFKLDEQGRIRLAYQQQIQQPADGSFFCGHDKALVRPLPGPGPGPEPSLSHSPGRAPRAGACEATGEVPTRPENAKSDLDGKSTASDDSKSSEEAPSVSEASASLSPECEDSGDGTHRPQIASNALRHPDWPPEWCDKDEWRLACRLADSIESTPTGEHVTGKGGAARASHLARLIQDAGKGAILRLSLGNCVEAIEALAAGAWQHDATLGKIIRSLQAYEDGCYPAPSAKGKAGPSRIEQAWRKLEEMRRTSFQQSRKNREKGFVTPGEIMDGGDAWRIGRWSPKLDDQGGG